MQTASGLRSRPGTPPATSFAHEQGGVRLTPFAGRAPRLRKDRLAGEKWRGQAAELLDRPGMVAVAAIQEGDERPCVNDDRPQRP
jgi:hypothetical protein